MLMLDKLGSRYNCLPSQALATATTFDLAVLTRCLEYYDRKQNPNKYKAKKQDFSQEDLLTILNTTKGK